MYSKKDLAIISKIKKSIEDMELSIIDEQDQPEQKIIVSELREGPISTCISTCYLPNNQTIQLHTFVSSLFFTDKLDVLYAMINLINLEMANIGGLCVDPGDGLSKLSSYIWISEKGLDREQLKTTITLLIHQAYQFVRQIVIAQHMNLSPDEMMERFRRDLETKTIKNIYH